MKHKAFIEKYFDIDEPKQGKIVPFKFRPVQEKYYQDLCNDYSEEENFAGAREMILKARRLGWSSMVLAIFASHMILSDDPVQYLCLSYKSEATKKLFRRFKLFVESYCEKKGVGFKSFVKTNNHNEIELSHNGSYFYIGTASARTGERGGTVQGIHFSEGAHYSDSELLTAQETIEGSMRQVDIDGGMIFIESTANGFGNYYEKLWHMAERGESRFKPRFFGWQDYYSEEQFEKIKKEFVDPLMLYQEYPSTPEEAFIASGSPFFDPIVLDWYMKSMMKPPDKHGYLMPGDPPYIDENPGGLWRVWEHPQPGQTYYLSCDVGQTHDNSSISILRLSTMEVVATFNGKMDSSELAVQLASAALWYNKGLVIPEINGLGAGLLVGLKGLNYSNIYRRRSFGHISDKPQDNLGYLTTSSTRPLMLTDIQDLVNRKEIKIYDEEAIKEMRSFARHPKTGKPEAQGGTHDDRVISLAILARITKEMPVSAESKEPPPDQERFNRWSHTSKVKSFRIGG